MARAAVADALLALGRMLDEQGAAQVGSSFSGNSVADELIDSEPNAFLFGVIFTQGILAERAWAGPWMLQQRLGTLDAAYLAHHPEQVRSAFQLPPMLHRFKETMPRWIVAASRRLLAEYEGDAANIWPAGTSVVEVTERLSRFEGIGRKKSVMAAEILMRHFDVDLTGRDCGSVAYDVHVRRVFLRSGLVEHDDPNEIALAAKELCPSSPGTLDLPAWLVGRETCRPQAPQCDKCLLGEVCPRLVQLTPEGVGVRRAG